MTTPERYWHVHVKLLGSKDRDYAVVNDLSISDVMANIVKPWHSGNPFTVDGKIVHSRTSLESIKITQTDEPKQAYSDRHYARQRASNIVDMATDSRLLPMSQGVDHTHDLLFASISNAPPEPEVGMVINLCQRLPAAARILATRDRNKPPYQITDEYDVQDLLHAVLRAYLKYSVHEEPLGKIGGGRSARADVAIEEIGTLVEVKFVHGPRDQSRIVEEFAQDLLLYTAWKPLRNFVYFVYNSADLRDPEALSRLGGAQEVNGVKFTAHVVLA